MNAGRPILGHEKIISYLDKSVQEAKTAHAYLFVGPNGVGKKTVALYFIKNLLCQKGRLKQSEINLNNFPDLHFVEKTEGKKLIGIEQIRNLIHALNLKNIDSPYKFAVIDQAEFLSQEAANSFLKTLEEPAKDTVIILVASRESLLPETIKSRCQLIRFNRVSPAAIYNFLKEERQMNPSAAKNLAVLSQGCPGRAINFAQNPDLYEDYRRQVDEFLELFSSDFSHKFLIASRLAKNRSGEEIKENLFIWLSVLRDMLFSRIGLDSEIIHLHKKKQYQKLGENCSYAYYLVLLKNLTRAIDLLKRNVNSHLVLENFILKI